MTRPDFIRSRLSVAEVAQFKAAANEAAERIRQLTADRDSLVTSLNSYTDMGAKLFAAIDAIVAEALGRPLEPGHTAAHATQLLADELARVRLERDGSKAQLLRLHRIVTMASHLTHAEVKALEGLTNTEACIAINAWNAKSNTEAKCRENRELRAERDRLRAVLRTIVDAEGDPADADDPRIGIAIRAQATARAALDGSRVLEQHGEPD